MKKFIVCIVMMGFITGCSYSEPDLKKVLSVCKDSGAEMKRMERFIQRITVMCDNGNSVVFYVN